ncbi:MAG: hypothetical protein M5T61_10480 [Acidimicrobiia bacterium]|nr:hypothetical protein [Acidimicrobiia bacterium]
MGDVLVPLQSALLGVQGSWDPETRTGCLDIVLPACSLGVNLGLAIRTPARMRTEPDPSPSAPRRVIVVLIIALLPRPESSKGRAPPGPPCSAHPSTLGMGALVTLLARSQGDAVRAATTTAIVPPPTPALTAADIAAIVRAELDADRQRSAVTMAVIPDRTTSDYATWV